MNEFDYLEMLKETSDLVAQEKASKLSNATVAFKESLNLTNDVEFWKWMGANYSNNLGNVSLIQKTAETKTRWMNTQLQGKGYEWDYMTTQRLKPSNLLSKFEAGDCPTQPGIDITESNMITGKSIKTYQNKAYLSSNNPDLSNTPKDAIVVTNEEKIKYAQNNGYQTEKYMDSDKISKVRDSRFKDASEGKAYNTYNLKNVITSAAKASIVGAVIGMTIETVCSYRAWKNGEITDQEYLKEVLKAGGDSGITAGVTTVAMIPVQATITAIGASSLITIPVAIILGTAINKVVAPCFGRGEYKKILHEAKYYQNLEEIYDDFIATVNKSSDLFMQYIQCMEQQRNYQKQMKNADKEINTQLDKLYKSI